MISKGSTVILRTKDAIYSPCTIVAISSLNITVTYSAGQKKDSRTGRLVKSHPIETIPRKEILKMSERT